MMVSSMQMGNAAAGVATATHSAAATAAGGSHATANPHEVRDADRARFFQDYIRDAVLQRFPDVDALVAAGYRPTMEGIDGPVHYTLGGYTNPDPNAPDGGVSDFSRPFSVMVEDGRITGVMLRAPGGAVDLGAGEWHAHEGEGGNSPLMHVWFDKPLEQAFGGHVPGFSELEERGRPGPVPKPTPVPKPRPRPPLPMPSPVPPPPVGGPGCCHSHGAHPTQFPLG